MLAERPPVELAPELEAAARNPTHFTARERLSYYRAVDNVRGARHLTTGLGLRGREADGFRQTFGMLPSPAWEGAWAALDKAIRGGKRSLGEQDRATLRDTTLDQYLGNLPD